MLSPEFFFYLKELSENNHKTWFDQNKSRYETHVKKPFEQLVGQVIEQLELIEGDWFLLPKDCIHRIYRDVRFSADKTPYKTNVSAIFVKGGRKNMAYPGYYFHIEAGFWQLAGGAYFLEKEPLHQVRSFIMNNNDEFNAIINEPNFKQHFGELKGEKNARLDSEFKEASIIQPLLFRKQFYFSCEENSKDCLSTDFPIKVGEFMKAAKPFNEFLRAALGV